MTAANRDPFTHSSLTLEPPSRFPPDHLFPRDSDSARTRDLCMGVSCTGFVTTSG